jgi:hypothetical protein
MQTSSVQQHPFKTFLHFSFSSLLSLFSSLQQVHSHPTSRLQTELTQVQSQSSCWQVEGEIEVQVEKQVQTCFSFSQQQADIAGNDWNFGRFELTVRLFVFVPNQWWNSRWSIWCLVGSDYLRFENGYLILDKSNRFLYIFVPWDYFDELTGARILMISTHPKPIDLLAFFLTNTNKTVNSHVNFLSVDFSQHFLVDLKILSQKAWFQNQRKFFWQYPPSLNLWMPDKLGIASDHDEQGMKTES